MSLTSSDGFFAIEDEMQRQREQRESVKGKATPFRVEYRFKGGSLHWAYFTSYEDALNARDVRKCRYNIWGNPVIEWPTSRQIQAKGKRGGWSKYKV